MKVPCFFIALIICLNIYGQHTSVISYPVTAGARLLSLNGKTIFVQQLDLNLGAQTWISYDEALKQTAVKKLVTPNAEQLASQLYLEGSTNIVRIDQFILGEELQLGIFGFDADGNLLGLKEIVFETKQNPLYPIPFLVAQSPDKKTFSLVQAANAKDSLEIRSVVFDENLTVSKNIFFKVPFDAELMEFYMPLVSDNGDVSVFTVEKFDSYRLNSVVNCFHVASEKMTPESFELSFARKKLKSVQMTAIGDDIGIQALFSHSKSKEKLSGVVFARFQPRSNQTISPTAWEFDEELPRDLKKAFPPDGRRGSLANYISILPPEDVVAGQELYGYLLPAQQNGAVKELGKATPDIERFQQVHTEVAARQSLVGTKPAGFSKPMNMAEAAAYAQTEIRVTDYSKTSNLDKPRKKQPLVRDLISFKAGDDKLQHDIFKLKTERNPAYNFFYYTRVNDSYGAFYYNSPTFDQPAFCHAQIAEDGTLAEKKLFDDASKIVLGDLPFMVENNQFVGFYEDQKTKEIGLVKLSL
ncbi:MAG: hypothetical protein ACO1OO_03700 [Flavisolibacter sp.]